MRDTYRVNGEPLPLHNGWRVLNVNWFNPGATIGSVGIVYAEKDGEQRAWIAVVPGNDELTDITFILSWGAKYHRINVDSAFEHFYKNINLVREDLIDAHRLFTESVNDGDTGGIWQSPGIPGYEEDLKEFGDCPWNENALIDISIPVKSILKIERALATLDLTLDPRLKAPPDQEDNAGHEAYDSEPKPA